MRLAHTRLPHPAADNLVQAVSRDVWLIMRLQVPVTGVALCGTLTAFCQAVGTMSRYMIKDAALQFVSYQAAHVAQCIISRGVFGIG